MTEEIRDEEVETRNEEIGEEKPEYPKHTEWADFDKVDNRVVVTKFNRPYTEYDVSFEDHFNGDSKYSKEERNALYKACMIACNENGGEYTIDCWNNRYTVRRLDSVETYHYEMMSETEKKKFDDDKKRVDLENERSALNLWLRNHDYIGIKISTGRARIRDYTEEIEMMNKYAARIKEINKELDDMN